MQRASYRLSRRFVALALLWGSLFAPSAVVAQDTGPFTVRCILFTATPNRSVSPVAPDSKASLPAVFNDLQRGSTALSLKTTPQEFLEALQQAEPEHTFQILLVGTAVSDSTGRAVVEAGPVDVLPQLTLRDTLSLEPVSPTEIVLKHTGEYAYNLPGTQGRDFTGWKDARRARFQFGRTYSQGIEMRPDGKKIVYAFCVFKGDSESANAAWKQPAGRNAVALTGEPVSR